MSLPKPADSRLPVVLWALACLVIVAAIVAGLLRTGGPQQQRAQRMDERRIADLNALQRDISHYLQTNGKLPERLGELKSVNARYYSHAVDPASGEPYEYRKTADSTFALCATFQTNTAPGERPDYDPPHGGIADIHPKGAYCFTLKQAGEQPRGNGYPRFQWVVE